MKNVAVVFHQKSTKNYCTDGIASAWILTRYLDMISSIRVNELSPMVKYMFKKLYRFKFTYLIPAHLELSYNRCKKYFNIDYYPYVHGSIDSLIDSLRKFPLNYDEVFFLDCLYSSTLMDLLFHFSENKSVTLTVIDHHKSNQKSIMDLKTRKLIVGDYYPNEVDCGATATWKYFKGEEPMPWFLNDIRLGDTGMEGYYDYPTKQPRSEQVCEAIRYSIAGKSIKQVFRFFDRLEKSEPYNKKILRLGKRIIDKRDSLISTEISNWEINQKFVKVGDYIVPYLKMSNQECFPYYSMVGNRLAYECSEHPFVAIRVGDSDGVSLRSVKDEVNLSLLAYKLGGGGHVRASGIPLTSVEFI